MTSLSYRLLALFGGALLATMISLNSRLAADSSPLFASWTAHGIGALAGLTLLAGLAFLRRTSDRPADIQTAPRWAYLGGVPGGLTVMLAAITVNSPLGLTGTLALGLVGQLIFGLVADALGWFGLPRRRPSSREAAQHALVLTGCGLLILSRSASL